MPNSSPQMIPDMLDWRQIWDHLGWTGILLVFAVTLPLVRSNSWEAQLTVPNDPRYDRLETILGIGQAKEG
ncbi:hypothetical protein TNCV_1396671 [Trichonephila clavipes]|nr:hypothetical protein TNCV_1396671 [Trichonephila clavipes]